MSKYDKYRISEPKTSIANKYAKYKVMPTVQEKSAWDTAGEYADVIGKQFNRGVASLADLPQTALSLAEGAINLPAKAYSKITGKEEPYNLDYWSSKPALSGKIQELSNQAGYSGFNEPVMDAPAKRVIGHGSNFAGSLVGGGGLGLAAKGAGALRTANFFNAPSTMAQAAKLAGTGAAIGGTSGLMQEGGANPLAADLASSVVAPMALAARPRHLFDAFKATGEAASKVPMKVMGLSPKKLNIEAATAARDLGIDLPAAALTESSLTGLADQWVGKTPFFGDKLKKKYANTEEQTRNALENIYEEVGPKRLPEVDDKIYRLYKERIASLPSDNSKVLPLNTIKSLEKIKVNSAYPSPDEEKLLQAVKTLKNELKPTIVTKDFGEVKIPIQDFSVERLIGTKQSLNSMIKWDVDEGVKNQLRSVQRGISQDIAEYGKQNPEWYKTYKEADSLFAKVAKREKLETNLSDKSINHARDTFSYNALSKAINDPVKSKLIQRDVSPEVFTKIQKLGKVVKAMDIKNSNIPNPSGTAPTLATMGLIGTISANPSLMFSTPIMGGVAGGLTVGHLLTDKKFLDLAIKFAEKGGKNMATSMALNKRIKDLTGYSAISLNNELLRLNQEEGQ